MEVNYAMMILHLYINCPTCDYYWDIFTNDEFTEQEIGYELTIDVNSKYENVGCKNFQKIMDKIGFELFCPKCGEKLKIPEII